MRTNVGAHLPHDRLAYMRQNLVHKSQTTSAARFLARRELKKLIVYATQIAQVCT